MQRAKLAHLLWVQAYLAEQGVHDRQVLAALRRALWGVRNPKGDALLRRARHTWRAFRATPGRIAATLLSRRR